MATLDCHLLTLLVTYRQLPHKAISFLIPFIPEHTMIVDIQTQELVAVATESQEQFVAVQDMDLMYVGGGTGTAVLF